MATIDIFSLIFEQILKIDPSIISNYATTQDQLLYLLLIPHIILFLFIIAFSKGVVGRVIGRHTGLEYLTMIGAYLVIVLGGWYGSFLVPLLVSWFYIAIGLALFVFLLSIIFHPSRTPQVASLFGGIAKNVASRPLEKRRLEEEIKAMEILIKELEIQEASAAPGKNTDKLQAEIAQVKRELSNKKTELQRAGRVFR